MLVKTSMCLLTHSRSERSTAATRRLPQLSVGRPAGFRPFNVNWTSGFAAHLHARGIAWTSA
jgi:hypothetical protein